jgi:hypothetical protein
MSDNQRLIQNIAKLGSPGLVLGLIENLPSPEGDEAKELLREYYALKQGWKWRKEPRHYFLEGEKRIERWKKVFTNCRSGSIWYSGVWEYNDDASKGRFIGDFYYYSRNMGGCIDDYDLRNLLLNLGYARFHPNYQYQPLIVRHPDLIASLLSHRFNVELRARRIIDLTVVKATTTPTSQKEAIYHESCFVPSGELTSTTDNLENNITFEDREINCRACGGSIHQLPVRR